MARVNPRNGRYELGGARDADLEGINPDEYEVFTDDEKLAAAQRDHPEYNWFASFTVRDRSGKPMESVPPYTLKFDRPASGSLYYYYRGATHPVPYEDTENKGNKKRVRATLTVGDPPVGMR